MDEEAGGKGGKVTLSVGGFAIEDLVCMALLVGILVVMSLGVFFRYVLNDSLTWTEEISRYGLVYITFLGCATAVRRGGHIRIDFLESVLPKRGRRMVRAVVDLLTLVFLAYMVVNTFQIMEVLRNTRSAAVGIPIGYVYLAILTGFTLSIFRLGGTYLRKAGDRR